MTTDITELQSRLISGPIAGKEDVEKIFSHTIEKITLNNRNTYFPEGDRNKKSTYVSIEYDDGTLLSLRDMSRSYCCYCSSYITTDDEPTLFVPSKMSCIRLSGVSETVALTEGQTHEIQRVSLVTDLGTLPFEFHHEHKWRDGGHNMGDQDCHKEFNIIGWFETGINLFYGNNIGRQRRFKE